MSIFDNIEKYSSIDLLIFIMYIFKKSIECGRVPSCDSKKANVTAIFKKSDKPHHLVIGLL